MTNDYSDFRVTMTARAPGQVSMAQGKGAIASASRQASELAIQVLQDGGNAFDAAFATAFSLCIYHPQAGNLGGGGYLLFQEKGAQPKVFNYREQAPMGATREDFLLPDGSPDPDKTAFGPTSVCVPGTVKAFFELQKRYGRLKAKDLLLAIAQRAEEGACITQYEADCLNRLAPKLAVSPESKRIYVRGERFDYRMFGVKGTQFPNGSAVQVDQFPGQLVLTYRLIRIVARLTADFLLAGNSAVTWNLVLSGAPAFAVDHDDHVLRKKESDTFAYGFEAGALTGLEFRLSDRASAVAALDVAYLRTKGDMEQYFYGDDPFTSNDETGKRYKNVVDRIIALGGSLSVGVRYRL